MNPAPVEPLAPPRSAGGSERVALRLWLLVAILSAGLGALAVNVGSRLATSAPIDLGPTDARYVHQFRDMERDGPTYFRWATVPSSSVILPVRFCGPGSVRLRVRRHFVDPAVLTVSIGGRIIGQRSVAARPDYPYEVIEFLVPEVTCDNNTQVLLESYTQNDRPLGVAVDWIEVRSTSGFGAPLQTTIRGAAVLAVVAIAVWASGGTLLGAASINLVAAGIISFGIQANPIAGERILRGGWAALVIMLGIGGLMVRLTSLRELSSRGRSVLLLVSLAALASRLAFLNPGAFYPDYRVHALVQQTLGRLGLTAFTHQLFEIQYERSLGLQSIDGRWYPFPYPPGSYVLANGVQRVFDLDPLDGATVTAVAASSLVPALTAAVGAALGWGEFIGLAGAFFAFLQPLLVRRLALGYFPGLTGQVADAVALVLLLRALKDPDSAPRLTFLGIGLLGAFLIYTQSIVNFGLLLLGLLLLALVRPVPGRGRATIRVALVAALALGASFGIFYSRYLPVMANIEHHQPQPEAVVLARLNQLREATALDTASAEADDLNDPYAGPTLNPFRGIARLGSRLWRFNGPFSVAILIAAVLLRGQSSRETQNLLLAWGGVALWVSLLAAGLPSPNGFQHLKDLEFVSPLIALALGVVSKYLWDKRPSLATIFCLGWAVFAIQAYLTEVADRVSQLAGF